jgi:hypothetical protein
MAAAGGAGAMIGGHGCGLPVFWTNRR